MDRASPGITNLAESKEVGCGLEFVVKENLGPPEDFSQHFRELYYGRTSFHVVVECGVLDRSLKVCGVSPSAEYYMRRGLSRRSTPKVGEGRETD